ncbi:hypothetical protein C8R46DRAFT_533927 [Mycena filopes]|nr:hypothetical protein C8R46DRAFT_533927 [Mycena filopes]
MVSCVASWTASLPYAPRQSHSPLRKDTATWNTKFPPGLNLDLSLPAAVPRRTPIGMTRYAPYASASTTTAPPQPQKPRLRLATAAPVPVVARFDPFAEDDPVAVASTSALPSQSQNTPPHAHHGPLTITVPTPAPAVEGGHGRVGRRRSPSFSAGTPRPNAPLSTLSALSLAASPSPAPSLTRGRSPSPPKPPPIVEEQVPTVAMAPSPFHARHYPTPDARARLLARTLLNRIHAVGRPRGPHGLYSCARQGGPMGYSVAVHKFTISSSPSSATHPAPRFLIDYDDTHAPSHSFPLSSHSPSSPLIPSTLLCSTSTYTFFSPSIVPFTTTYYVFIHSPSAPLDTYTILDYSPNTCT